jgi:hydroxypyruvate isomerase
MTHDAHDAFAYRVHRAGLYGTHMSESVICVMCVIVERRNANERLSQTLRETHRSVASQLAPRNPKPNSVAKQVKKPNKVSEPS